MRKKQAVCNLVFNTFQQFSTLYWSRNMLNISFWEKSLGLDSPQYSVCDFLIVWLLLLLKTKTSRSWERKELFQVTWKAFFIIFKGLPIAKNCLRPGCASLKFGLFLLKLKSHCFIKTFACPFCIIVTLERLNSVS